MVASALSEHSDTLVRVGNLDLLRVAAVYGPNASGKSSLFHALSFMRTAVLESHRSWSPDGGIPRMPFALSLNAVLEPSLLAVDVVIDGVRYEYGFTADSVRIHEEWLYAYPRGRRQEWFTRDASRDLEYVFSRALPGENRAISALTRPNSLFLSAAAQNNHEMLAPLYSWFSQKLWIVDDSTRTFFENYTIEQCRNEAYRKSLFSMLQAADLGIADIEFSEEDLPPEARQVLLSTRDPNLLDALRRAYSSPRVQFWHSAGDAGGSAVLPFDEESRGTRTLFSLLGIVWWSLNSGSILVVDELDQSLHSHLARNIVSTFMSSTSNPRFAQLMFNTHDTNLLDKNLLRRDQIWFTEKGYDGASKIYPLTDFHARKEENLERGYLQGRYGAVPAVPALSFSSDLG
jgi:uncharacterized protein